MQKLMYIRRSRGSAIITSLVMGLVFTITGITILRLASRGSELGHRNIESIKSYWANEGFMRLALRTLSVDQGNTKGDPRDFSGAVTFGDEIVLNGYKASSADVFEVATRAGCTGAYNLTIKTKMKKDPLYSLTTIDNVVIKSLQRYTFFEDSTSDIQWSDFVVKGDFHSNGVIKVERDMSYIAHVEGQTTTSGDATETVSYESPYDKGIVVTKDGAVQSSVSKDTLKHWFPDYAHIGKIHTYYLDPDSFYTPRFSDQDLLEVDTISGEVGIRFDGSNTYIYGNTGSGWDVIELNPSQEIIKTFNKTTVWGELSGKKTIVTDNNRNLVIGGSVTYSGETGPISETNTSDVVALVSGGNIIVPDKFECSVPNHSSYSYSHSFKDNGGVVHGCLFSESGGLLVDNIGNFEKKASIDLLNEFKVYGSLLVHKDLEKILEYTDGNFAGLNCIYERDIRYYRNTIAPPGVPFPRADDWETNGYMWILASGKWENRLVP